MAQNSPAAIDVKSDYLFNLKMSAIQLNQKQKEVASV